MKDSEGREIPTVDKSGKVAAQYLLGLKKKILGERLNIRKTIRVPESLFVSKNKDDIEKGVCSDLLGQFMEEIRSHIVHNSLGKITSVGNIGGLIDYSGSLNVVILDEDDIERLTAVINLVIEILHKLAPEDNDECQEINLKK